ncbi:MAG: hypothetical protein HYY24_05705 [Verrucomicrobia bacterium]|nr:hypothetical protein [Verrucomicrobiota bacterium]
MKPYELVSLTAGIFHFFLTFFVLTRDLRAAINRAYALWGFSLTLWNLSAFCMFRAPDAATGQFWAQFLWLGVVFLPISICHLCLLMAQINIGRALPALYLMHLGFAATIFTGHFVGDVRRIHVGYYSIPGPVFWAYMGVYVAVAVATVAMLYTKQRALPRLHQTRLRSLLLAYGLLLLCGTNDLLPILGLDRYPLTNIPFYPMGNLAAILFGLVVCYSVLQHQLLDIHITLGRLAARLVRLMFFFLVGLCLLLLLTAIAPNQFTLFTFFSSLGVLLVSSLIASVFFPRLFGDGSDALERRILGDRFEYHDKIRGFTESMPWYSDPDGLLNDFEELLLKTVRVRSYHIILLDEATRVFSLFRAYPDQDPTQYPELHATSPVFEHFQATKVDYLALNHDYAMAGETTRERAVRQQLKKFDAEFCFPFFSGDDLFGLLLIGAKTSGEPYTPHDLHLFTSLVTNLSLNLNQIRLKKQIWAAQELELMGRMSRGLAHDLNNLITPISTFLQLAASAAHHNDPGAELLPIALRNVDTVRAYINEALFFSQNQVPQFQADRLDLLVCKGVELAETKLRRDEGMAIVVHELPEVTIHMDAVLILRLISNLLSNAIDASPPGAKIEIDLQTLARTEPHRDWYRLRVIDHGEGISRENLKRVFTPYFTTKDHGDERRGFGLGLAISRKIVHLHGGNLKIESEQNRGTVVAVDLPSRPIQNAHAPVKAPL